MFVATATKMYVTVWTDAGWGDRLGSVWKKGKARWLGLKIGTVFQLSVSLLELKPLN